jgi:hypothetical protein
MNKDYAHLGEEKSVRRASANPSSRQLSNLMTTACATTTP